jgi:arylsulfatase
LQAPQQYIDQYRGAYDIGYDSLRSRRFQGLKEKGIIGVSAKLPDLPSLKGALYGITEKPLVSWSSLTEEQKRIEAHKMEIYAGMVSNLDYNVGRLVEHLKQTGEFDNTLFVFFSDNGAAVLDENMTPQGVDVYQAMGTANSFVGYGPPWAHASSAAFSFYKGYSSEGGIRTPMIIKMPGEQQGRGVSPAFATVMDMAPTFLELAGGTYPDVYEGRTLAPVRGESMLPFLLGERNAVHDDSHAVGWELFGRCALRKGHWKLSKIEIPFGKSRFELFKLSEDPGETVDLSGEYPEKYRELLEEWERYVEENGVILQE